MPLLDAKCPNCGQVLQVDNSKEAAICEYCGSAFIVEKAIHNYNITNGYHIGEGATVNIHSTDSLEKLLQNGETSLRIKNYSLALETYTKCTKSYPEAYQGWWGFIRAHTHDFTALTGVDTNRINSCYSYITKLCTDRNELAKMEDAYKGYLYILAQHDTTAVRCSLGETVDKTRANIADFANAISTAENRLKKLKKEKIKQITHLIVALCLLALIGTYAMYEIFNDSGGIISLGAILLGIFGGIVDIKYQNQKGRLSLSQLKSEIAKEKQTVSSGNNHQAVEKANLQQLLQLQQLSDDTFSRFLYIEYCNKYQLDPGFTIPEFNQIKQLLDRYSVRYQRR